MFDIDKVDWLRYNEAGMADLMCQLASLKKDDIMRDGFYTIELGEVLDTVRLMYHTKVKKRIAIFNFGLKSGEVSVDTVDGEYKNLLTNEVIRVKAGKVMLTAEPIVFEANQ